MRLEKDGSQGLDIACRGCAVMEMEGMMVLLEQGDGCGKSRLIRVSNFRFALVFRLQSGELLSSQCGLYSIQVRY